MSQINVDTIKNREGSGGIALPNSAVVTGVLTATSFKGDITGNVTGNATGLTGTPSIVIQDLVGVGATFSGALTYEDVTQIDSIGIVTAQTGVKVTAGGVDITAGGLKVTAGVTTFSNTTDSGSTTTGALVISGGVGIAKSMYIGGNIAFADGKGLDFSATADGSGATVSSEVLDDYEEGLWTGTIKYDTNTPSTDSNVCQYVKVGNLCHAQGRISVTNDPGGNALTCTGLPFAASNPTGDGNSACGSVYMEATSANVDYGWVIAFVPDGDTTIYFRQSGMTDAGNDVADHADSGTNYMFSVVYRTA